MPSTIDPVLRHATSTGTSRASPLRRTFDTFRHAVFDGLIPNRQNRIDSQLRHAARNGSVGQVRTLLGRGADPTAVSRTKGYNAVHEAARCEKPEVMEAILARGSPAADLDRLARLNPQYSPLHIAAVTRNRAAVRQLLAARADPLLRNNHGQTPYAALRQQAVDHSPEAVRLFEARRKADPNSCQAQLALAAQAVQGDLPTGVTPPGYEE
jgi:hypothetical protein